MKISVMQIIPRRNSSQLSYEPCRFVYSVSGGFLVRHSLHLVKLFSFLDLIVTANGLARNSELYLFHFTAL